MSPLRRINLAILKIITLNLIRRHPAKRKVRIRTRRFIVAISDRYHEHLIGIAWES